ncbi:hypothetical protein ABBQ32_008564 [Trebouxia sp. C0010 RCD-2024]
MLQLTSESCFCLKVLSPGKIQEPVFGAVNRARDKHQHFRNLLAPPVLRRGPSIVWKAAVSGLSTVPMASREREVTFTNPSNESLAGIFLDAGSSKTAILCHGYTDHKNGFHLPAIAEALANRGWSSLRFDFSGNGKSEGSFRYGNYNEEKTYDQE